MTENQCGCPDIEPADWEGQEHDLSHLSFFVRPIKYFFGSPMGFEQQAMEAANEIQRRGYVLAEPLFVLEQPGRFSGRLLIGILPPSESDPSLLSFANARFVAKVYKRKEPSYDAGLKAFLNDARSFGLEYKSVLMWHVGCPKCVARTGYTTVILGELPE